MAAVVCMVGSSACRLQTVPSIHRNRLSKSFFPRKTHAGSKSTLRSVFYSLGCQPLPFSVGCHVHHKRVFGREDQCLRICCVPFRVSVRFSKSLKVASWLTLARLVCLCIGKAATRHYRSRRNSQRNASRDLHWWGAVGWPAIGGFSILPRPRSKPKPLRDWPWVPNVPWVLRIVPWGLPNVPRVLPNVLWVLPIVPRLLPCVHWGCQMFPECCRMIPECWRRFLECCQMFTECCQTCPECCRMFRVLPNVPLLLLIAHWVLPIVPCVLLESANTCVLHNRGQQSLWYASLSEIHLLRRPIQT
jgi:hypothetical protein